MTDATFGTGNATLPEHLSSHPVIRVVRVARFLVFYFMFCRSLFVLLAIVFPSIYDICLLLWYLRFTTSDYSFSILDLRHLITPLVS
jgi:hypothetical protein